MRIWGCWKRIIAEADHELFNMKKILVIEDDFSLRRNITEILEQEQYQVVSTEDGYKGIELIRTHPIDLVVCDVVMPQINGYEVLTQVRLQSEITPIAFIFLTAKADKSDVRHGMELGADDYLTKPFTRTDLLSAVKTRLEKQSTVHHQYQQKIQELREQLSTRLPHELLTPLSSIISLSSYLTSYASILQSETVSEIASLVCQSAQRIDRTVQKSLLYAKLNIDIQNEAHSVYQQDSCDYTENAVTSTAMSTARRSNRTVDLSLERSDCLVAIARTNLEKIVEELVENACKFSPSSHPIYVASRFQENDFILEVTDCGEGLAPEQVIAIGTYVQFERKFYEQQGTGLGLVIVRQFIELHGGRLEASSSPEGTTMRVVLPIKKS